MKLYRDGRAYESNNFTTESYVDENGIEMKYTVISEPIENITVIGTEEIIITDKFPNPIVYGAKKILIMFSPSNNMQEYYDVLDDKIIKDNDFLGDDWLYESKPDTVDTLTPYLIQKDNELNKLRGDAK